MKNINDRIENVVLMTAWMVLRAVKSGPARVGEEALDYLDGCDPCVSDMVYKLLNRDGTEPALLDDNGNITSLGYMVAELSLSEFKEFCADMFGQDNWSISDSVFIPMIRGMAEPGEWLPASKFPVPFQAWLRNARHYLPVEVDGEGGETKVRLSS